MCLESVLMPMAAAGLFAMKKGLMEPMMTLVLHLIFGSVLGWVYGRQIGRAEHRWVPRQGHT